MDREGSDTRVNFPLDLAVALIVQIPVALAEFGDRRVRLNVVLSIQPARLGLPGEVTPEAALAFLSQRVETGMRAQLANASLLTGGLKIDLVQVDDASSARLRTTVGTMLV